jgi:hypothetical protein
VCGTAPGLQLTNMNALLTPIPIATPSSHHPHTGTRVHLTVPRGSPLNRGVPRKSPACHVLHGMALPSLATLTVRMLLMFVASAVATQSSTFARPRYAPRGRIPTGRRGNPMEALPDFGARSWTGGCYILWRGQGGALPGSALMSTPALGASARDWAALQRWARGTGARSIAPPVGLLPARRRLVPARGL